MDKEKRKIWDKQYKEKNPEKVKESALTYYYRNRERLKQVARERAKNNKEKRKLLLKEWRANNPEKVKAQNKRTHQKHRAKRLTENKIRYRKHEKERCAYSKNWRAENKEKVINQRHIRRSRTKNTDITTKYLRELWGKTDICEICDKTMEDNGSYPNGRHLDHIIPLNIGGKHIKSNVRYICAECNIARPHDGSDCLKLVSNF